METFIDNGITYTAKINNGFVTICGDYPTSAIPVETEGLVSIPNKCVINGTEYIINKLYAHSFLHTKVTSIIVPENIVELVGAVFECARELVFVDLSKSKVKSIGKYCFSRCTKIETILLKERFP